MKITVEVSRKNFDELPYYLQEATMQSEIKILQEDWQEESDRVIDFFDYELIEKYNFNPYNSPKSIKISADYVLFEKEAFEKVFLENLRKKCQGYLENTEDISVILQTKYFGVKRVGLPHIKVESTPMEDIKINIPEDYLEDKKKNILVEANKLYANMQDLFLNVYNSFSCIPNDDKIYESTEEIVKDRYYYIDNKDNILLFLTKKDFKTVNQADNYAKKELTKTFSKRDINFDSKETIL